MKNNKKMVLVLLVATILVGNVLINEVNAEPLTGWKKAYYDVMVNYNYKPEYYSGNPREGDSSNLNYDNIGYFKVFTPKLLNLSGKKIPELIIFKSDALSNTSDNWKSFEIYTYENGKAVKINHSTPKVMSSGSLNFKQNKEANKDFLYIENGWDKEFSKYQVVLEGNKLKLKSIDDIPNDTKMDQDIRPMYKNKTSRKPVLIFKGEYGDDVIHLIGKEFATKVLDEYKWGDEKPVLKKEVKLSIDGKDIKSDVEPTIKNGRTLVPLRVISENLGYKVDWNQKSWTAKLTKDNTVIEIIKGKKNILVNENGKKRNIQIDVPAEIINGRTMIPIRAIAEISGSKVDWDNTNWKVNINSNNKENKQIKTKEYKDITNKYASNEYAKTIGKNVKLTGAFSRILDKNKTGMFLKDNKFLNSKNQSFIVDLNLEADDDFAFRYILNFPKNIDTSKISIEGDGLKATIYGELQENPVKAYTYYEGKDVYYGEYPIIIVDKIEFK